MITKTASSSPQAALVALAKAISDMNLETKIDIGELFSKLLITSGKKEDTMEKKSMCESVKIASLEIKDTNFQVDVGKDFVQKDGKELIMLSVYAREINEGQSLIKRNYYYLTENEDDADNSFNEIVAKVNKIKRNYHSGRIISKVIFEDIKKILFGIISDIKFQEEDVIGTTLRRLP